MHVLVLSERPDNPKSLSVPSPAPVTFDGRVLRFDTFYPSFRHEWSETREEERHGRTCVCAYVCGTPTVP